MQAVELLRGAIVAADVAATVPGPAGMVGRVISLGLNLGLAFAEAQRDPVAELETLLGHVRAETEKAWADELRRRFPDT